MQSGDLEERVHLRGETARLVTRKESRFQSIHIQTEYSLAVALDVISFGQPADHEQVSQVLESDHAIAREQQLKVGTKENAMLSVMIGQWLFWDGTVVFDERCDTRGDIPNEIERIVRLDNIEFAFEL